MADQDCWRCKDDPFGACVAHRPKRSRDTHVAGVYFLQCGEFVKIGSTRDLVGRVRGIHAGMPTGEVALLGYIPEPPNILREVVEAQLHERFAHLRERGEWFRFTHELEVFIAGHAQALTLVSVRS